MVTAAEAHTNSPLGVVLPWRLCSGFARGRRWPHLAFAELEKRATADPRVVNVKLENDFDRLLYVAYPAAYAVNSAAKLYELRGRKP